MKRKAVEEINLERKKNINNASPVEITPLCPGHDVMDIEHASLNPYDLVNCIVSMVYTQQHLHQSFVWFLDSALLPQINLLKWSICVDGFPVRNFSDGAAMHCFQLLNLPGFVNMPEFSFPQAVYLDSENSKLSWNLLREVDDVVLKLETKRLLLKLSEYPQNQTVSQ
jgi:hypothetical protein